MSKLLLERYYAGREALLESELARARVAHDEAGVLALLTTREHHHTVWQHLEKVWFAESSIDLLNTVLTRVNELDPQVVWDDDTLHSCWLEFPHPFRSGSIAVQAMLFERLYDEDMVRLTKARVHDRRMQEGLDNFTQYSGVYSLELIDSTGTPVFYLSFDHTYLWRLMTWHECPSGQCRYEGSELVEPCTECQSLRSYWGMLLGVCLLVRRRYFAEEVVEHVRFTDTRRVPRKGNPNKDRTVPVSHVFQVIDASRVTVRLFEEPYVPEERRGSWVAQHDASDIDYIDQTVSRTYRHPRYINMHGFTQRVTRHIPVLRSRRERLITKLIASDYEEEEL